MSTAVHQAYRSEIVDAGETDQVLGNGKAANILHRLTIIVDDPTDCEVSLKKGGAAGTGQVVFNDDPGAGIGTYPLVFDEECGIDGGFAITTAPGVRVRAIGVFNNS